MIKKSQFMHQFIVCDIFMSLNPLIYPPIPTLTIAYALSRSKNQCEK